MTNQRIPAKQAKTHKVANERSDAFTFSDHIRELRIRIMWVALVFVVTSALAYNYHDQLVQFVMAPLNGGKLIYLTPGGGFSFIFQITLYAGLVAAAPVLTYQIYSFLRPIVPKQAQKNAIKVALFATLLMIVGVAYGYFVAIPAALTFLSTFAGAEIIPNLTADSYLSFFLSYVGGLALLFQLPLLLIFWHWINPMKPGGLLKSERFIIVFAFIAAALITPTPDVVNQAMIAIPLIAIYQIGVFTVLISIWRHKKRSEKLPIKTTASHTATTNDVPRQPDVARRPVLAPALSSVAAPTSPLNSLRSRRSIDGFTSVASHKPLSVPPTPVQRHITVPARPVPIMNRRSLLRIDGVSPL